MKLNVKNFLSSVRISRQLIILFLIVSLLTILALSSRGGSRTELYDSKEGDVIFRGFPSQINIPNLDENINFSRDYTDFPSLTPPDDVVGGVITDIPIPTDGPGIDTNVFPTDIGEIPEELSGILGTGRDPLEPTLPPLANDPVNTVDGRPIRPNRGGDLPPRPNKARNLVNVSKFDIIPTVRLQFLNDILSKFNLSFENLLFVFVIVGVIYYPLFGVNQVINQLTKKDEDQDNSIFFTPFVSEEEIRRAEDRQRRLKSFDTYIDELIELTKKRQKKMDPGELIVITYHELDKAFNEFGRLKRTKDLTPLEHSKLEFEMGEIRNEALVGIVNLFYRSRFGHKKLNDNDIKSLIKYLENLVDKGVIQNSEEQLSRWRIFG